MSGNSMLQDVENVVTSLTTGGLPTFDGLAWLVQHLLTLGEDPVSFIGTLVAHIEGRANVGAVLAEFTDGVMTYGLEGFARVQGNKILRPVLNTLQTHSATGYQLASLHQQTISTMQSKLTTLTSGQTSSGAAYSGDGATTMMDSLSTVTTRLNTLTSSSGSAQDQINRDFANAMSTYLEGVLAIDLAILAVEVAVATGVVTIPPELVLDAGVLLVELLGFIILFCVEGVIWICRTIWLQQQMQFDDSSSSTPQVRQPNDGKIQPKPPRRDFPPQMRDALLKAFIAAYGAKSLTEFLNTMTPAQKQLLADLFGVDPNALAQYMQYCLEKNPLMTTQQFIDALTARNAIARDQALLNDLNAKQTDPRYQGPGLNESFINMQNNIKTDIGVLTKLENRIIMADYSKSSQVNQSARDLSDADGRFKGWWGTWNLAKYYGDKGQLLFFDQRFENTDVDVGIRDGNSIKLLQVKTLNSSYSPYQRKNRQLVYDKNGQVEYAKKFNDLRGNIEGTQHAINDQAKMDEEKKKYKWFSGHATIEVDLINTQGDGNWSEVDKVVHDKYPGVEVHTTNPLNSSQQDIDYNGHTDNPLYNQDFRNSVTTLPELNPDWCLPPTN